MGFINEPQFLKLYFIEGKFSKLTDWKIWYLNITDCMENGFTQYGILRTANTEVLPQYRIYNMWPSA